VDATSRCDFDGRGWRLTKGREDWSDRGIKTWIMSVMEMVTVKVLEIVTVKALETMSVKARIKMVRYCLNDAVRLVVMGYVDL